VISEVLGPSGKNSGSMRFCKEWPMPLDILPNVIEYFSGTAARKFNCRIICIYEYSSAHSGNFFLSLKNFKNENSSQSKAVQLQHLKGTVARD
jgi:hypothetical protein